MPWQKPGNSALRAPGRLLRTLRTARSRRPPGVGQGASAPPPCSCQPAGSAAGWPALRKPPRPAPARREPTTPGAPTPPTGKCSPPGSAARACPRRRPIPQQSGSILRAGRAARPSFRRHPRAAAVGRRLALPPARPAARRPRPAYRDRARRRPPPPRSPSPAEGRHLRRRLLAMLATLDMDLRGLRDPAILAIGFAAACAAPRSLGSIMARTRARTAPAGSNLPRGRPAHHPCRLGRARSRSAGSRSKTCPVALLETWLRLRRIARGHCSAPDAQEQQRRIGAAHGQACRPPGEDLRARRRPARRPDGGRPAITFAPIVRAGLASSAEIKEAHVQKRLGHASAEMTRRCQRQRDRFKVNLTKAAGL